MIAIGTYVLLWILAGMLAVVTVVIVRDLSEIRSRVPAGSRQQNGLALLGERAPEFSAVSLRSGLSVHSADLRGRVITLCMLSTGCRDCIALIDELVSADVGTSSGLILYCSGEPEACRTHMSRVPASIPILVDGDSHLISDFRVLGLPMVIIIDEHWTVVGYRYPRAARDVIDSIPRRDPSPPERHVA